MLLSIDPFAILHIHFLPKDEGRPILYNNCTFTRLNSNTFAAMFHNDLFTHVGGLLGDAHAMKLNSSLLRVEFDFEYQIRKDMVDKALEFIDFAIANFMCDNHLITVWIDGEKKMEEHIQ